MALPDPLSIKNAAAVAQTFTRRLPIANGNRYMTTASTPALSDFIDIRSITTPSKGTRKGATSSSNPSGFKEGNMRNIVTFGRLRTDIDDLQHIGSTSISFVRPLGADILDADVNDLFAFMADFLVASTADYKNRFIRGEV